jgi:nucleotidyltransferase substrate binding protein (TIGR01987 family)
MNLTAFEKALRAFNSSINVCQRYLMDLNSDSVLKTTLQAGVIQHFEFCYELSWKMLKRRIELDAAQTSMIDALSYPELIREGAERGLIDNTKQWLYYRHQRNLTSHTYDQEISIEVYKTALSFYQDAYKLFLMLKAKNM